LNSSLIFRDEIRFFITVKLFVECLKFCCNSTESIFNEPSGKVKESKNGKTFSFNKVLQHYRK